MFKTPSPDLLGRRRIPGNTPPHLQFLGLNRPAGLRDDGDADGLEEEVVEPPTLLELLQAHLDKIDEEQDVEVAVTSGPEFGTCAREFDEHTLTMVAEEEYTPDFCAPNFADIDVAGTCFFPCYKQGPAPPEPMVYELDETVPVEPWPALPQPSIAKYEPPLFPREAALFQLRQKAAAPTPARGITSSAARLGTALRSAHAPASTSLPSRTRPTSAAPPSRIHSRAGSSVSSAGRATSRPVSKRQQESAPEEIVSGIDLPIDEFVLTL